MNKQLDNTGKVLGKQVEYPHRYSPDILEAIPRSLNRTLYGIASSQLPFCGIDVWHAYEIGFLTLKGFPITGLLKLIIPCNSPCIVESKSLKLYLNSFNMERFGSTPAEGIETILNCIRNDIERLLTCSIQLSFFNRMSEITASDFDNYILMDENPALHSAGFTHYTETPQLLLGELHPHSKMQAATHLLRSNCKITRQPDWGSAFIHIEGSRIPSYSSLLRYIVSIRNENHFHEEICEMIFQRLNTLFLPERLMVTCIYTRRGGIDISPVRSTHPQLIPGMLSTSSQLSTKLLRQ